LEKSLTVFHGRSVIFENADQPARHFRLYLVHELHGLDNADHLTLVDHIADGDEASELVLSGSIGKLDTDGLMDKAAPPSSSPRKGDARFEIVPPARLGELPGGTLLLDKDVTRSGMKARKTTKTFSLESDPWLKDHSIDGTPWVAGVMGLELLVETASGLMDGQVPAV